MDRTNPVTHRPLSLADYERQVVIEEAELLTDMAAEWLRMTIRLRAVCRMQADAIRALKAANAC